jgi:hypothetical protein
VQVEALRSAIPLLAAPVVEATTEAVASAASAASSAPRVVDAGFEPVDQAEDAGEG